MDARGARGLSRSCAHISLEPPAERFHTDSGGSCRLEAMTAHRALLSLAGLPGRRRVSPHKRRKAPGPAVTLSGCSFGRSGESFVNERHKEFIRDWIAR